MKLMNVLLSMCGLSVMAADVRVRVADGVPQLQVDGVPPRPHGNTIEWLTACRNCKSMVFPCGRGGFSVALKCNSLP